MAPKKHYSLITLFLILVLCTNLANVQAVHADGETPTEPPAATEVVTQPPAVVESPATAAPVEATPVPQEATVAPVEESAAQSVDVESAPTEVVFSEAPENTDIVVLGEQGQALSLGTQETANALATSDPVWCPEGVSSPTPGTNGCSTSYGSVADLLAAMQADPESFSQNGTIFLEKTEGEGFTSPLILDDSSASLGTSFNSLNLFNLTVQGGWDPATGNTADQTSFNGPNGYIQIGSLTNPWIGSLTLKDISVSGASRDGIQLFASEVVLTDVNASYNAENGISITANKPGTVTLNNVNASHNGHMGGSEPVGSGVYVNGASTLVNVIGGTFINDARYGIEAVNSTSSTFPIANLWTDQDDYVPGSLVTISGNDNSLNGNNVGFLFGEAVHVVVQGPNGYMSTCDGTANSYGGWSCQITLWTSNLAVGDYTYTATGLSSGISITGSFTDGRTVNSATLNSGSSATVAPGGAITVVVSVTTTSAGGPQWRATRWQIGSSSVCVNHTNHSSAGTYSETFTVTAPSTPGTYDLIITAYDDNTCSSGASSRTFSGAVTVSTPTSTATTTATSTATSTSTSTATTTATTTSTSTATVTATSTATVTVTSTTTTDTATVPPTVAPTDVVTNTPDTNSPAEPQSLEPKGSSPMSSAFVIPLTSGELIDLNCNSVFWVLGVKLSFLNLCDQQTTIHSVSQQDLPAQLPAGFSLVLGLKVDVLTNGTSIQELPNGTGIQMDFPAPSGTQFAMLYWDGSRWVEVSEQASSSEISSIISSTAGNGLYRLTDGADNFYPILTAHRTGIFVLVKK